MLSWYQIGWHKFNANWNSYTCMEHTSHCDCTGMHVKHCPSTLTAFEQYQLRKHRVHLSWPARFRQLQQLDLGRCGRDSVSVKTWAQQPLHYMYKKMLPGWRELRVLHWFSIAILMDIFKIQLTLGPQKALYVFSTKQLYSTRPINRLWCPL